MFFIWSLLKTGYQAGQGGTIQVDLDADDNTAAHQPSGVSLASVSYGNIIAQDNNYPELPSRTRSPSKAARLYHLVFTNVDPAPAANYISMDASTPTPRPRPCSPA